MLPVLPPSRLPLIIRIHNINGLFWKWLTHWRSDESNLSETAVGETGRHVIVKEVKYKLCLCVCTWNSLFTRKAFAGNATHARLLSCFSVLKVSCTWLHGSESSCWIFHRKTKCGLFQNDQSFIAFHLFLLFPFLSWTFESLHSVLRFLVCLHYLNK